MTPLEIFKVTVLVLLTIFTYKAASNFKIQKKKRKAH
jgi:uncharacterized PurR-regulated membrane protein YhhQ (DUF165 family)